MINSVVIMGRLTKNPEYQAGAKAFSKFTVAVDRSYKQGVTDFIPCIVFGKTAEFVYNHFTKGQMIALEGELHVDKYTGSDGGTRYSYSVVANNVSFCGKEENKQSQPVANEPVFDETPEQQYIENNESDLPF